MRMFKPTAVALALSLAAISQPAAARCIQSDPIGLTGGINICLCRGNPVSRIDPWGLDYLIIAGGMKEGSYNPFGHISMAITGYGMFSYGNNTDLSSSVTAYDPKSKHDEKSAHHCHSNNASSRCGSSLLLRPAQTFFIPQGPLPY